jgi:hypothetical protein
MSISDGSGGGGGAAMWFPSTLVRKVPEGRRRDVGGGELEDMFSYDQIQTPVRPPNTLVHGSVVARKRKKQKQKRKRRNKNEMQTKSSTRAANNKARQVAMLLYANQALGIPF